MKDLARQAIARSVSSPRTSMWSAQSAASRIGEIGLISQWLLEPAQFDLAEDATRFADALIDMLRTLSGPARGPWVIARLEAVARSAPERGGGPGGF